MTAVNTATTHGFLFADLRGYTHFVETRGDDAAAGLLRRYRALVREVISEFGGAEIRTEGDSFYVVFPLASSAVLGGLAILAAADQATRANPGEPLTVGIGIHAGETAETGEGPVGSAVNIAARVCAQARAGELLVTDTVRSLTRTRLTVTFTPRGSPSLKGIKEPIFHFAVRVAAEPIALGADAGGQGRLRHAWIQLRAHPVARWVVPGAAVAAVLTALIGTSLLLGSPRPSGSPIPVSITSLPPLADVPFYRADDHRSSIYAGPAPIGEPQVAWQVQLDGAARFTPIVVDGSVIMGDLSGVVRALDARTGEERWRFRSKNGGGFTASAAAADGLIFVADLAGTLHGLDATTGVQRWATPLQNSGVRPVVAEDGLLYVGSSDGKAFGLDTATGQKRWSWEGPAGTPVEVSVVSEGVAYIGGGGVLYAIRLVDKENAWPPVNTISTNQSVALLDGDTIFMAALPVPGEVSRSELLAIDRATGEPRWRWQSPSGLQVNPSVVLDGIVYVVTTDDGVYALRDGGSAAQQIWHTSVPGSGLPISLVGDILYLGANEGPLIALSGSDGHVLWETPSDLAGTTNPVVSGGMIFQVDGELSVIRAWAEPDVLALLPRPAVRPSATAEATAPPDPFEVVSIFPSSQTGIQVPADMDVGPEGRLYVLHAKPDASNPLVTIIDPRTGRPISGGTWGGRLGNGKGEFSLHGDGENGPSGCIAVGPDRLLYVGDFQNGRIEVFKADGTFVRQIGSQGDDPGQLLRVSDCDVGQDGSLYTLDHDNQYLSKFEASGRFIWRMRADPESADLASQLHGFTIQQDGKLLGFTDQTGQVLTIDPADGRIIGSWGTPGNEPGQMGDSGEPSVDSAGNIYVFQYVPMELQVFDASGRLLGGQYHEAGQPITTRGDTPDAVGWGDVFWPAPVFGSGGFGYTFGPDGLTKLKVMLPRQ
jgi:outer membrane protein assembly factor BamB/class 3 adenylate cyclase